MTNRAVKSWVDALDGYDYPVDLQEYVPRTPRLGFFDTYIGGDRKATMRFERRFRKLAPTELPAWQEVVFWKMYTQPGRRQRITSAVAEAMSHYAPDNLWHRAATARKSFGGAGGKQALKDLIGAFFRSTSVATAWTFVAFSSADGSFPMVDTRTGNWAHENYRRFSAQGLCGAGILRAPRYRFGRGKGERSVIDLSFYDDFIVPWVLWCRCLARELTKQTGEKWRARDVEMAVFHAADTKNGITLLPF